MRKRCLFLVTLFVVTFSVVLSHSQLNLDQNSGNLVKERITNPISASLHSPIFIDGNSALNAFCSGKGTTGVSWETAHVIENYEIDAGGSGSGIEIRNTNLYLIIRNITALNSGIGTYDAGIYLDNCTNVKIIDSKIFNNKFGIRLDDSRDNNLTGNNAWNNSRVSFKLHYSSNNSLSFNYAWNNTNPGFSLSNSNNNTLSSNNASYNGEYGFGVAGFSLSNSNNNTLSGNRAWNNTWCGITLGSSDYNLLTENHVWNNIDEGFCILFSKNNTLLENFASENSLGFYFQNCDNNTLSGNNAWNNTNSGFSISYSNNNTISGNFASGNNKGVHLGDSNNNTLSGNEVLNNFYDGFSIDRSNYNEITGNIFSENHDGINLWLSNYNLLSRNIFIGGFYGLISSSSSNNRFSENYAWNNKENSFYLATSTNNNIIWSNFFINSLGTNARDDGVNNQWDNGIIGNFWGDYLEKYPEASDIGGIWDTPYEIVGYLGPIDRFPLVNTLTLDDNNLSAKFSSNMTEINARHWIQFLYNITSGNPPFTFQWNFGDGSANSTEPNPIHQYNLHGNFTVTLTVTDFEGKKDTISINNYVRVIDLLPTANFMANNTQISMNYNNVLFTYTGFEGDLPTTFQWNFGDGTANSSERNPIHTYISLGDYTVTLTVTDFDGNMDTITKENYVSLIDLFPIADFHTTITQIDLNNITAQFVFDGFEGDEPATFQWSFGDGTVNSTERNPVHQYNSIGNYTVILTITDVDGDSDVIIKIDYIQVQDNPDPDPDPDPDDTGDILNYIMGWSFGIGSLGIVIGIIIFVFKKRGSKFTGDEPLFLN